MIQKNVINLIAVFENLVNDLIEYAKDNGVTLRFKSEFKEILDYNDADKVKEEFSTLIKNIINFTPDSQSVSVFLIKRNEKNISVEINNTGISLHRIRELVNDLKYYISVQETKELGTLFKITVPIKIESSMIMDSRLINENNLGFKPYYQEIKNKLTDYFKEIDNLQTAIDKQDQKQGVFLRKINTIISSRLDDNDFKVEALAAEMALSRTQLFRRMKALTKMSPSEYLLYFRLHVARDLLKTEQNGFNVSEVGYQVGFVSKSHFSRSFQKQFGLSPSYYRKMQR